MKIGVLNWQACEYCEHMNEKGCELEEGEILIDYELRVILCTRFQNREDCIDRVIVARDKAMTTEPK